MAKGRRTSSFLQLIDSPSEAALWRCLDMFLLHQEASRSTPRTIETYRETLAPFVEHLAEQGVTDPTQITPTHIRRFFVDLEKRGLASATVHKHARSVKAWLNFLVREDVLDDSPMRKVSMPKVEKKAPNPFTPRDIDALLKACQGDFVLRNRAIILCLLDTGLRASEFLSLKVGDVESDGMVKVQGKGQKERWVRLGATARKALLRHMAERKNAKAGDALWTGKQGPLTLSGLEKVLRKLGARAGVKPANPHRFRATFATWSAAAGMDAHSLRFLLGHASLEIARRYVEMAKADIEEAHKRASPVDRFLSKRRG